MPSRADFVKLKVAIQQRQKIATPENWFPLLAEA